ncbi:MAG: hypothetical protein ACKVU1_15625, partial [bacterium]
MKSVSGIWSCPMLLVVALLVPAMAQATLISVPADQPTIQDGIDAAAAGDTVEVTLGTYVIATTVNVNKANLLLRGVGVGSTVVQVANPTVAFNITATGVTFRDFTVEKTDLPGAPHHLVNVAASNTTILNNLFYGPDPGTPWNVNGIVSRAMIVYSSLTGILIQGNTVHHLRQPAYLDPGTVGTITGNDVYGTRGWVNDGANITFTANTWGPIGNQGADIALLVSINPIWYPNLLALSNANSNAYISGQYVGASSGRATAYVDDSAAPSGNGGSTAPYQTVTDGVGGALPGGTVDIAAGTYTEQVVVSGKNLTLDGAGSGTTFVNAPAVLATTFTTSGPNKPVITATNADVTIQELAVDGLGLGNANNRIVGIGYWNAGGAILDCTIDQIRNTPLDGVQAGVGILVANNTGGPYALEVGDVTITDFQKNGTVFAGSGLAVDVHDCSITGAGPTALIAQNGIQISSGAAGTVTSCAVSDVFYSPASVTAVGLLIFGPGSVNVTGTNPLSVCQTGVYYIDADGSVSGVNATGGSWGAVAYNTSASFAGKSALEARDNTTQPRATAPFEGAGSAFSSPNPPTTNSVMSFSITNGCLVGSATTGSIGVEAYTAGGGLNVSVSGMEIANWDYGISSEAAAVSITANDNAITGNLTAGFDNTLSLSAQNAESNWWGAASGPGGVGPGTGDAIAGTGVDFTPWLITGADTNAGCGFAPGPDNVITPGPVSGCITDGSCMTVPVAIARTTSDPMRGFSVTFSLSPELVLCSGLGSITEGTYLSGVPLSTTNFQVISNGGGSYTADCAILGMPCGATAATGTLFNVSVKKSGGDGTGTVTVTSVLARDCANAPIAATPGAPLSITIDTAAPAAVTNLSATQVKTGNDG